ncbi:hypothetical protein FHR38_000904 [Micromonospora polyrhachis]|uniref:Uncharacterized protein n=1 Tax=Micromonospora polyrhachis TaxID=1282883 RepID=A0A7W7SM54_9ACTN|nr:hypothetical protein [Micromonospora polyrhachis]
MRFSGRQAQQPDTVDPVTREAYSHEVISAGCWRFVPVTRCIRLVVVVAVLVAGLAGCQTIAGRQCLTG